MECKVDGCCRDATYKTQQVCQKHYFRMMRNGSYGKKLIRIHGPRGRKYRMTNPAGYQKLDIRDHPLADSSGYVYEHRVVIYAEYGDNLPDCDICGKLTNWETCHVDHIDEDVTNNRIENLRPVCRGCNTKRGIIPCLVTVNDTSLTLKDWAKRDDVSVCLATIRRRIKDGWSTADAIYGVKITHNGKKPKKPPRKTIFLHDRSNSVSATIEGITQTATEWSKDPRCNVSDATIRNRIKAGWPHDERMLKRIKSDYTKMAKELT